MAGDNRLTTENFLRLNFSPNSGITPGTNDLLNMDCDQVKTRYNVTVSGISSTGLRLPGQNQLATAAAPAVVSMACTGASYPEAGVVQYTLTLTAVASAPVTGTVYFDLDFLSGSVPSGQAEARGASISKIPELPNQFIGAGTIRSYTATFAAGTTNVVFNLSLHNDNWDSPVPVSSFRVRLIAGSGTTLSVPNSTVTNGTTFVTSLGGILTTFLTMTVYNSTRGISGDMIYCRMDAASYSASQKSTVQVLAEFGTTSYNTDRSFVGLVVTESTYRNYTSGQVYRHNDNALYQVGSFNAYSPGVYIRFYLRNVSGTTGNYTMNISPYKYCSFTNVAFSSSIASLNLGNIISMYDATYSGTNTWQLPRIQVFPGSISLASTDVFTYKFVAHCPTGGYIHFFREGNGVALYDGMEVTGSYAEYYDFDDVPFTGGMLVDSNQPQNTTIAFKAGGSQYFTFNQSDQWIDLVPVTSNIVVSSLYPHKLNSGGIY